MGSHMQVYFFGSFWMQQLLVVRASDPPCKKKKAKVEEREKDIDL